MRCSEAFADAESALSAIDTDLIPDVILLDVELPGMDGLSALKRFAEMAPEIRVVLLTVFNDTNKIFNAVCAGANGYLLKTSPADQVLSAVRQAAAGGAPMDPEVAERVLTLFNQLAEAKARPHLTTDSAFAKSKSSNKWPRA